MKELTELEYELRNYIRDEGIYELVLHSDDVKLLMDSNKSTTSAETLKIVMEEIKRGAIAFVSDRDYIFGLCRQLEIRLENEFIQMCVFRTEETARKWLHEMQSLNKAYGSNG